MNEALAKSLAEDIMVNKRWHDFVNQICTDAKQSGCFTGTTFELTAFCTLKCPMCYVRLDKENARLLGRPCSAGEWISLAKQFRDQGGIFLLLTGGEPMMRPDFPEIYTEISKMGLLITLYTNGTTIDDKMLELLKKRPPSLVGITIYGASEETYERFGGNRGSFQKAVDGLDRLLTIPNITIDVRFTVCSENYKDFKAVSDLVARRNKMVTLNFGTCAPVRGAISNSRKLRLSKEQLEEVNTIHDEISAPVLKEYKKLNNTSENTEVIENGNLNDTDRGLRCKGGKTGVYIAWNGIMYPCDMAGFPYAFPLEQGFKDAANDIRRQIDSLLLPEKCLTCVNRKEICTCIPKALNEMRDCARTGEKCNYISM